MRGAGGGGGGILGARSSGILLHPTSLPGPHGIGELGPGAYAFLDWLSAAGQSLWQVLPLGPTGYGDSPYACFSSFAGNPLLISLETLAGWGLLDRGEIEGAPASSQERVEFGPLIQWKLPLLRRAAKRFSHGSREELSGELARFQNREAWWLDDYALFMAVKRAFEEQAREKGTVSGAWNDGWDRDIALRQPGAVERWKARLREEILEEKTIQFFFSWQWDRLHAAAREKGIRIIGDLPIFAAPDSADVWANRDIFLLDREGKPIAVSGVPPDYFAATGQLWGNPLYDWEALERQGFRFWIQRIGSACRLFDLVRIDHFRGFEACWSVPAGSPTAEHGQWVKVPGVRLFQALQRELGTLPIVAEDLGVITPEVTALRERFGFPGMRILQFAFDQGEAGSLGAENRFLPHNHSRDSVVYTGTHDNDTTRGWWETRSPAEQADFDAYAPYSEPEIQWRMIRMALSSVCRAAIVPLQDVLGLGTEARMNTPGTASSRNWSWRAPPGSFSAETARRLRSLAEIYGRARQAVRPATPSPAVGTIPAPRPS
jgi:4-alpha-glucanotransferase